MDKYIFYEQIMNKPITRMKLYKNKNYSQLKINKSRILDVIIIGDSWSIEFGIIPQCGLNFYAKRKIGHF